MSAEDDLINITQRFIDLADQLPSDSLTRELILNPDKGASYSSYYSAATDDINKKYHPEIVLVLERIKRLALFSSAGIN